MEKSMRFEMQRREIELIDMIMTRGIQEHKTTFADYPKLNDELMKLQDELYREDK